MKLQQILKMKILNYFISILLVFTVFFSVQAQEQKKKTRPKYVVPEDRPSYFRISVDPTRYLYPLIDGIDRNGIEFSIDTEVKGKYFPVLELGQEAVSLDRENYTLDGAGFFIRAGADNNFLKYQNNNDRDMFFMGVRMAYAFLSQDANNIAINNNGIDEIFNYNNQNFNVIWGEITLGIKTELTKNIFLGWTIRGKQRFYSSKQDITPYSIPGFGKYNKNFNVAANIYISYAIPLKTKKE